MRSFPLLLFILSVFFFVSFGQSLSSDDHLRLKAGKLAEQIIIVDSHVDVPYRLRNKWEDISRQTSSGNFDYPRAKRGGLNAPFMSIYIPSEYEATGGAKALADTLIGMVEKFAKDWPDKFALARSVADVTSHFRKKRISLCMGMENGSPLEHSLANVKYFFDRGIRYITLTHGKDNHISDSSYDTTRTWRGLSPFGRRVVAEMNRVGIMVDVSHISDNAFSDVMNMTQAPVIASHSSCRHFTPGFERNLSDEMIKRLASNGGVIMINFGSSFLDGEYQKKETQVWMYLSQNKLRPDQPAALEFIERFRKENPLPRITVAHVVDHIDHVAKLVGVDFVGLGSDFDGVGDSLPEGLKDVSQYPNIIFELLKRGYSENDIRKICGGNLLRVWSKVEQKAGQLQAGR
ncbi:MAG TPA: peptidase M19 [Bacteroidetes bacterium]|nr:peptidase M19 [Bacteroidota bacterium]